MTDARQTAEAIPCPVCDKTSTPAGAEVVYAEPLTHCEWCGAEYPQPDDAPAAGTSTRRSAAEGG